jgi:hypothetical protein
MIDYMKKYTRQQVNRTMNLISFFMIPTFIISSLWLESLTLLKLGVTGFVMLIAGMFFPLFFND